MTSLDEEEIPFLFDPESQTPPETSILGSTPTSTLHSRPAFLDELPSSQRPSPRPSHGHTPAASEVAGSPPRPSGWLGFAGRGRGWSLSSVTLRFEARDRPRTGSVQWPGGEWHGAKSRSPHPGMDVLASVEFEPKESLVQRFWRMLEPFLVCFPTEDPEF